MLAGLLAIVPGAPALAGSPPTGRFEQLRERDLRVATVAYRLSIANAGRCDRTLAPQLGFVLHSIGQYGVADRDGAARSFGLGSRIGVMAVVDGSPADAAGIAAKDQLISVNGHAFGNDDAAGRAAVDRAQDLLVEEMRRGPVILRLSGPGGERDVRIDAAVGCPANVELSADAAVNAWADGNRVIVSEGLLRLCKTDDDLALVIAHEMAHNLLRHRRRLAAGSNGLLASAHAGSAAMRESEEEADRLAVRLAAGAAYDLSGAEAFMNGLLDRTLRAALTHPDRERRLALLRTAVAEAQGVSRSGNTAAIGLVSGRM